MISNRKKRVIGSHPAETPYMVDRGEWTIQWIDLSISFFLHCYPHTLRMKMFVVSESLLVSSPFSFLTFAFHLLAFCLFFFWTEATVYDSANVLGSDLIANFRLFPTRLERCPGEEHTWLSRTAVGLRIICSSSLLVVATELSATVASQFKVTLEVHWGSWLPILVAPVAVLELKG